MRNELYKPLITGIDVVFDRGILTSASIGGFYGITFYLSASLLLKLEMTNAHFTFHLNVHSTC